ncbi:MAG: ATP-binding cassette domain-containing protein, partial [Clostridia bacterium]|nr:ATP-binding cassette domain-containing protein [Clostridia bacterium]
MALLTLKDVSYVYSEGTPFEKKALDNVNVTFKNGIITGLIGHTGSGKSTLVQLLNGLNKPTSGHIYLDGVDIWEKPK